MAASARLARWEVAAVDRLLEELLGRDEDGPDTPSHVAPPCGGV
jgi:hypothetical protein